MTDTCVSSTMSESCAGALDGHVPAPQGVPPEPGSIPLCNLSPHPYNRSAGEELDPKYVESLAESIRACRQQHPVILVRDPAKPGHYLIVAGVHRVAANRHLRGEDGVLQSGEYVLRTDLTPACDECMKIAVEENAMRRGTSPATMARHVARLVGQAGKSQQWVAKMLGQNREVVNALASLPAHYAKLPEPWRHDLEQVDGDKPAITITHWRMVKARVEKEGVSPELREVMERAAKEKWSVARLKKEITPPASSSKDTGGAAPQGVVAATTVEGEGEPASPGESASAAQGGRPDFAGMIAQLKRVRAMAHANVKALAILDTAMSELKALSMDEQPGTPAEAA